MQYPSSITTKVAMALAGLFLVTFLSVHLAINLLLLLDDGGEAFASAAEFMATNPLIRLFEVVLLFSFGLHMFLGMLVSGRNRAARPTGYDAGERTPTSFLSRYMFHTGMIVLLFLAVHAADFYLIKVGLLDPPAGIGRHDFYARAMVLFSSPLYSLFYALSFVALGFHLNHAFQAAFQTLGLNHSRYMGIVRMAGTAYAIVVSAGFAFIPLKLAFFSTPPPF